jgi:hypothetical protein
MLELLGLGEIFSNPKSWMALLLLCAVLLLLRTVADLNNDIKLIKKEASHHVTNAFLSSYSTQNDRHLLTRVRDSVDRANARSGGGSEAHRRLVHELDAEIESLSGSFGGGAHSGGATADDDERDIDAAGYDDQQEDDQPDFGTSTLPSSKVRSQPHIRGRATEFEIY